MIICIPRKSACQTIFITIIIVLKSPEPLKHLNLKCHWNIKITWTYMVLISIFSILWKVWVCLFFTTCSADCLGRNVTILSLVVGVSIVISSDSPADTSGQSISMQSQSFFGAPFCVLLLHMQETHFITAQFSLCTKTTKTSEKRFIMQIPS